MIKTRWRLFGNLRKGMEKMDKKDEIMLVNQESLTEKIYIIRGQKVMLDFELAAQIRDMMLEVKVLD